MPNQNGSEWPEEEDHVRRALSGDRNAFDGLLRKHQQRLQSYVKLHLGPRLRPHADDICQTTYLRAIKSFSGFMYRGPGSFFRWLCAIAEHAIADAGGVPRGPEPINGTEIICVLPTPSKRKQAEERFERLSKALDALCPDYRDVIILGIVRRLPRDEIARRMNRPSASAVSMLLGRALRELRAQFGDTDSFDLPPWTLDRPTNGSQNPNAPKPDDMSPQDHTSADPPPME